MPPHVLRTYKQAIDALGGVVYVAALCGVSRNAVSNWYKRGFPPEKHDLLGSRLRHAGYEFPLSWFKQSEAAIPTPRSNGGKK